MAHQPGEAVDRHDDIRDLQHRLIKHHHQLASRIFPGTQTRGASGEKAAGAADSSPVVEQQEEMIHCAASQGVNFMVLALLADERVHPDARDRFGRTALHWAAGQGHLETVITLSSSGACLHARSHCNADPLMLAALGGHANVVRHLLHAEANASSRHHQGPSRHAEWRTTALHFAARGGHVGVVTTLLNAGFRRDQHDKAGLTPAEISARSRQPFSPAVTNLLLGDGRGGKLVHGYVNMVMEDVEIVRGLAEGRAFLDWQDQQHGRTPLHRAVHFRHFQTLKILLQAGANPNLADRHGITPLHLVAVSGCTAGMAGLLDAGADTAARTHDSYSPLHLVVTFNRVGVASLLLRAPGSSSELRDLYLGITPLSWASRLGFTPMLRVLLEAGADVDSRSPMGLTPLHWACRANNAEIVESLLDAGADLDAVDGMRADAGSVIGLGDPVGCTGPHGAPFMSMMAVREGEPRLDTAATNRIRRALEGAKKDRAWRRRGWLVVLASRRELTASARDSSNVRPQRSGTALVGGPMPSPKRSGEGAIGGSSQGTASRCPLVSDARGTKDCAVPLVEPAVAEALLGLAAVESGVFRNVVRFI